MPHFIKKLAKTTREAVAMREMSKSAAIKFKQKLKFAKIELAQKLKEQNTIEYESDLFHLTHKEIGSALHGKLQNTHQLIKER